MTIWTLWRTWKPLPVALTRLRPRGAGRQRTTNANAIYPLHCDRSPSSAEQDAANRRLAVEDRVDLRRDLVDRLPCRRPGGPGRAPRNRAGSAAVLARYSAIRRRTVCSLSSGRRMNSVEPHTSQTPSGRGRLKHVVIAGAAAGAGEAPGDALDQRVLVDLELDHMVEAAAALGEQQVERFGLLAGAREAVEDRAAGRRRRRAARRSAR